MKEVGGGESLLSANEEGKSVEKVRQRGLKVTLLVRYKCGELK